MSLTSRQRILNAFSHKQSDRTPIFEYVLLSPVADIILGRHYTDFGGDFYGWVRCAKELGFVKALRKYARDRLELAVKLSHDMLYCVPNPSSQIVERDFSKRNVQHENRMDSDPVEAVKKHNLAVRENLSKPSGKDYVLVYHYIREEMEKEGLDLPIYAPAFSHGVWTDVDLMQTMVLDPDVAHEHFELMTRRAEKQIDDFLEIGIDIIGIGGDFAGNRPLISPECYKTFITPGLEKLSSRIHSRGKYAVNASDGNLWSVIDDFLITSGVDAYGEIDAGAGMDLKRLKQRYGDRITFLGNMDCGNVLSFSSPEQIAALTVKCIEDGFENGGHIFTASNAISASVPVENYIAMVNAYRDYFNMDKFTLQTGG